MASNVTEITEQSTVQLEIIESDGGGQIEIISPLPDSLEISFSGSSISSDLEVTTQTNTLVVDTTSDNTTVDILQNNPTIIESTITNNVVEITEDQVVFQTGSVFNTVNNTIIEGGNLTNVLFQTQSDISNAVLSNLVIKDFSNNVSLNVNGGKLELIFGSPSEPFFNDIQIVSFDTNRFNLVNDSYIITPIYNLNGATFINGSISSSQTGISTFSDGNSIEINPNTTPFMASGSHNLVVNITTQLSDNSIYVISIEKEINLNKIPPTDPILNITYNISPLNAYNNTQNEIEQYANGNITWSTTGGTTTPNNNVGWLNNTPQFSTPSIGIEPIGDTNSIIIPKVEEYWNSGDENSPQIYYTGSYPARTWTRIKSLRYGTFLYNDEWNISDLRNIENWESNIGTIEYGKNTTSEIEPITLNFLPNQSTGEYLYIVYDAALPNINTLINQLSFQNEITAFNSPYIVEGYKIYVTSTKKDGANYQHKITFI